MAARKTTLKVEVEKQQKQDEHGNNLAGRPKMLIPDSVIDEVCDMMCLDTMSERQVLLKLGINRKTWWKMKRENESFRARIMVAKDEMISEDMDVMVEKADQAFDRDTAAAASIQVKAREIRARMIFRNIYGTPLPVKVLGADDEFTRAYIVVPAKVPTDRTKMAPAIEGECVTVTDVARAKADEAEQATYQTEAPAKFASIQRLEQPAPKKFNTDIQNKLRQLAREQRRK